MKKETDPVLEKIGTIFVRILISMVLVAILAALGLVFLATIKNLAEVTL